MRMLRRRKLLVEGRLKLQQVLRRGVAEHAKFIELLFELHVKLVSIMRRVR